MGTYSFRLTPCLTLLLTPQLVTLPPDVSSNNVPLNIRVGQPKIADCGRTFCRGKPVEDHGPICWETGELQSSLLSRQRRGREHKNRTRRRNRRRRRRSSCSLGQICNSGLNRRRGMNRGRRRGHGGGSGEGSRRSSVNIREGEKG